MRTLAPTGRSRQGVAPSNAHTPPGSLAGAGSALLCKRAVAPAQIFCLGGLLSPHCSTAAREASGRACRGYTTWPYPAMHRDPKRQSSSSKHGGRPTCPGAGPREHTDALIQVASLTPLRLPPLSLACVRTASAESEHGSAGVPGHTPPTPGQPAHDSASYNCYRPHHLSAQQGQHLNLGLLHAGPELSLWTTPTSEAPQAGADFDGRG